MRIKITPYRYVLDSHKMSVNKYSREYPQISFEVLYGNIYLEMDIYIRKTQYDSPRLILELNRSHKNKRFYVAFPIEGKVSTVVETYALVEAPDE